MVTVLVITTILSALGLAVFFALSFWAAREDGRDQQRRDSRFPR